MKTSKWDSRCVLASLAMVSCSLAAEELPALDCVINPNEVVEVSSAVPGVIEEILVDRSDYVEVGDVVARLAAGVEKASVELARARTRLEPEIEASQVNVEYDRKRQHRLDSLYGQAVISEQNREEAEREAKLSVWKLEQARDLQNVRALELRRAEALLEQKTIRSTLSGFVTERFKTRGEYVEDQPIVRVAQLDPLRIDAIVPMAAFGKVKLGMKAEIFPATGPDGAREAEVTVVDPVGDPGSGTFGVRLRLPNDDFLIPAGTRCQMRFVPGSAPANAPVIRRRATVASTADVPVTGEESAMAPRSEMPSNRPDREPTRVADQNAGVGDHVAGGNQQPNAESSKPPVQTPAGWHPITLAGTTVDESGPASQPTSKAAPAKKQESHVAQAATQTQRANTTPEVTEVLSVGPFVSFSKAANMGDLLHQQGFDNRMVKASGVLPLRMVVTREPASEETKRLLAENLSDYRLLTSEPYVGRISLGVYGSDENAARRKRAVDALGIDTTIVPRGDPREAFWLEVEVASDADRDAIEAIVERTSEGLRFVSTDGVW